MDVFAVIADPTRRIMLEMLTSGERAAGEFVAAFPHVSQPAISQHLKVLRDSGLATVRTDRQRRLYSLNLAALESSRQWLDALAPKAEASAEPPVTEPPQKREKKTRQMPAPAPEPTMFDLFG